MRRSDQSQDTSFQSHIFEKWEKCSKVAKMTIFGSVVNSGDEFTALLDEVLLSWYFACTCAVFFQLNFLPYAWAQNIGEGSNK